jgi:WD40 repeat protein
MKAIQPVLLSILAGAQQEAINLEDFLKYSSFWRNDLYHELIELWKDGKIFVSKIDKKPEGYLPPLDSLWSVSKVDGYYGYRAHEGVFQIIQGVDEPANLRLEATLYVGTPINRVAVAPNRDDFLVGDQDGVISIGKVSHAGFYKRFKAHKGRIWSLDYSPDGSNFVSGSSDGIINLWDRHGSHICTVGTVANSWVVSVRFLPDGQHILSSHKIDDDPQNTRRIRLWSIDPPEQVSSFMHHEKNVYSLHVTSSGDGFVSGGSDKQVAYYSLSKQEVMFQKKEHTGTVACVKISPDNSTIVSGSWNGGIKLWNLLTGEVFHKIEAHNTRVLDLDFSPSGKFLVSGSRDSQIIVWTMPDGEFFTNVLAHKGWVRSVSFVNEDTIISGGSEGICKIWKLTI